MDEKYRKTNHPHYGTVIYNEDGLPQCHICGIHCKMPLLHAYKKHHITAKEYKFMFGLDSTKGITCEDTKQKLRSAVDRNYKKVVVENLLNRGQVSRFQIQWHGRTRNMLSEQTRKKVILNINRMKKKFMLTK